MKYYYLGLVLLFGALLSCTKKGPQSAHDPLWGKEVCSHCRMILSEKRFAAQLIENSGKVFYYDDIGCALQHARAHQLDPHKISVRPHPQEQWIPADQASFAAGLSTPMNSGYGATLEGGTLSFSELLLKLEAKESTHEPSEH